MDFAGKDIYLRAENRYGTGECLIDCESLGRAFLFDDGETAGAAVDGFTITGGYVVDDDGGGIKCEGSSSPTIRNCVIEGCSAVYSAVAANGGGIACSVSSSPVIDNCVIFDNDASNDGGGIYCFNGSNPGLTDCEIAENRSARGGGLCCVNSCAPATTGCHFEANVTVDGGGVACDQSSSPVLYDTMIVGNWASNGGGIHCTNSSSLTVVSCCIFENWASGVSSVGGGIYIGSSSNPTIVNCVIARNSGADGGGIACDDAAYTAINCTIVNNVANTGGGLYCDNNSDANLQNSLIGDNAASSGGAQMYTQDAPSTFTLDYCDYRDAPGDIGGLGTVTPNNCIHVDPEFVRPAGDDYRLREDSPCIDAGDNSFLPLGITEDLDGNTRVVDGDGDTTATVDMGAFEYQP
jgi:hypothetical protein